MPWIRIAAALGFLGVALGAFGAHALRKRLLEEHVEVYKTAVLYHLVHAAAVLGLALYARTANVSVDLAAGLLTGGVLLFSGSLYALTITRIRKLGIITPFGGLLFLGGWGVVFAQLG